MKITFVSPHSLRNFGGGERWHISIGNMLVEKGIEVEMYAMSYIPTAKPRLTMEEVNSMIKFPYHEIDFKAGKYNPRRMKKVPQLASDVFYISGGYYFFLRQCLKFSGPKIFGFHDPALQTPENLLQRMIVNKLFPKFNSIHILNEQQKILIPLSVKTFLLPNTWFEQLPAFEDKFEKFTVFFFGRHEVSKGIDTLEYVLSHLSREIEFFIAGSGSVKINLPEDKPNVYFLGFVDDKELSYYLSRSHVVLFPSYSEASSGVATETLAHSTPLVYRDIPQNGLLNNIDLNIKCKSNQEFLTAIQNLKKLYETDKMGYFERCKKLGKSLITPETYINTIIGEAKKLV